MSAHRSVWRRIVLVALLTALCFLVVATAVAAETDIKVVSSTAENAYPANVKFAVEAQSSSDIAKITLRYKVGNRQSTSFSNVEFKSGPVVSAAHTWNTQRQYVPPGVDIEYYWQIEDVAGNRLQTTPAKLNVVDTRFEWQSADAGNLALHWYSGDERFAQDLLDAGTRAVKQLSEEVGAELDRPVRLYIYEKQKDMLGAMAPRDVEWVGGQAFPEDGVILLNVDTSSAGRAFGIRAVAHELSHLIVHAVTDNPFGGVPAWLDEGLAVYAEGPVDSQADALLKQASAGDTLLSLQSISGRFPTDDRQARLAYAESYSVVRHLLSKHGRDKMSRLWGIFREGSTADRALRAVYGWGVSGLEQEWRASIGAKTLEGTAVATQREDPARSALATPANEGSASQSSGRSCAGGLFLVTGALGGLLLYGRGKGIANESRDRL